MRTRQERVATDTWRSLGYRTTPLEHWSKRKPTVEPRSRWRRSQTYEVINLWWCHMFYATRSHLMLQFILAEKHKKISSSHLITIVPKPWRSSGHHIWRCNNTFPCLPPPCGNPKTKYQEQKMLEQTFSTLVVTLVQINRKWCKLKLDLVSIHYNFWSVSINSFQIWDKEAARLIILTQIDEN